MSAAAAVTRAAVKALCEALAEAHEVLGRTIAEAEQARAEADDIGRERDAANARLSEALTRVLQLTEERDQARDEAEVSDERTVAAIAEAETFREAMARALRWLPPGDVAEPDSVRDAVLVWGPSGLRMWQWDDGPPQAWRTDGAPDDAVDWAAVTAGAALVAVIRPPDPEPEIERCDCGCGGYWTAPPAGPMTPDPEPEADEPMAHDAGCRGLCECKP